MTSHWLLKTATGMLAVSLLAATLAPATSLARGTGGANGASGGGRGTDGGSSSSGGASSSTGGGTGGGDAGRGNGDGDRFPPRSVPPRIVVTDQRLRPDCVGRRLTDDWGYAQLRRSCFRARFDGWN